MNQEDWMKKAAEEIVASETRIPRVAATIIAKHCPFKLDSAYVELIPVKPGHLNDWATRCAGYIATSERKSSVSRLAAIITFFTDPLLKLLRESTKAHDSTCPAEEDEDEPCICGADEWNARIDEATK